jgi:hypothetical protein
MDRHTARDTLARCGAPLDADFHALGSSVIEAIVEAARAYGYRKPKNANGSRARYFHAYLMRTAERAS